MTIFTVNQCFKERFFIRNEVLFAHNFWQSLKFHFQFVFSGLHFSFTWSSPLPSPFPLPPSWTRLQTPARPGVPKL